MHRAVGGPSLRALGSRFIRTQVCTSSGQTTTSAVACDLLKCQVNIVGLCGRLCPGDEAWGRPPSIRSVWNGVRQSRLFVLSGSGHPNSGTVTKRAKRKGLPCLVGQNFPLEKTCVCVCTSLWTVAVCHCPVTSFFALCPSDGVLEIRLVHGRSLHYVGSVGFSHFLANDVSVFSTRSQSSHKPC